MSEKTIISSILVLLTLLAMAPLLCRPANSATYDVTIWSWDYVKGWPPVNFTMDGIYYSTPHTFTGLTGTHTFVVPTFNSEGHPFSDWDVGGSNWTDPTLTVSSAGTYTARYRQGFGVTFWSWCDSEGWLTEEMTFYPSSGGIPSWFNTPATFYNFPPNENYRFSAPSLDVAGHQFYEWSTGSTSTYLDVSQAGVYTARYHKSPTGAIIINAGATYTASQTVLLSLTYEAYGGSTANGMRFRNDGGSWTAWFDPFSSWVWDLAAGDGSKTVYFQIRDSKGAMSSVYQDAIILDMTPPQGGITINYGAPYCNSTSVELALWAGDSGGLGQERLSNDSITWTPWGRYGSAQSLTPGDGPKTIYYQVQDVAGNTAVFSDSIILDTFAPRGGFWISSNTVPPFEDTVYASSTSVTIRWSWYSVGASNLSQVRYSNDGIWDTEQWENWVQDPGTRAWTLTPGDGTKTVYCQLKSNSGMVSSMVISDSIILQSTTDTTPPTGSVVINGGAAATSSTSVTLTLSATDAESGVSQMRFNNGGTEWSTWEAYATSKSWTLTSYDDTKTVYVQFKNGAGLDSVSYSDTITLQTQTDTTPPPGSITINGDAATTNSASVVLTLSATDPESGVTQMRLSNDGTSWSNWEPYTTPKAWTLTTGDGAKTVYAQFKNGAGLTSTSYSDSITLQSSSSDTTPPTGSITINGGAATTNSALVALTLSATDNSGVVAQMRFANLGESWTTWEPYTTTKTWTLASGTGTKTVLAQFKDGSNIESAPYGDTILFDSSFEEKTFNVTVGTSVYPVNTRSNSTVSDFSFNQALKRIRFNANATTGTTGFANITIPAALISGDFTLFMDDTQLVKDAGYTQTYNGTHYFFNIGHGAGVHVIEVFGTNVIPEFSSAWISLTLLVALTTTAIALSRRGRGFRKLQQTNPEKRTRLT